MAVKKKTEDKKAFREFCNEVRRGISRCYDSLKVRGLPVSGWRLVDHYVCDSDDSNDWETCEACGYKKIKYVYLVYHPDVMKSLKVGSVCVVRITGESPEHIFEIDQEMRRHERTETKRKILFDDLLEPNTWTVMPVTPWQPKPGKKRKMSGELRGFTVKLYHRKDNPELYCIKIEYTGQSWYINGDHKGCFKKEQGWRRLVSAAFDGCLQIKVSCGK